MSSNIISTNNQQDEAPEIQAQLTQETKNLIKILMYGHEAYVTQQKLEELNKARAEAGLKGAEQLTEEDMIPLTDIIGDRIKLPDDPPAFFPEPITEINGIPVEQWKDDRVHGAMEEILKRRIEERMRKRQPWLMPSYKDTKERIDSLSEFIDFGDAGRYDVKVNLMIDFIRELMRKQQSSTIIEKNDLCHRAD